MLLRRPGSTHFPLPSRPASAVILPFLLLLLLLPGPSLGKLATGSINVAQPFSFLDKFCFDTGENLDAGSITGKFVVSSTQVGTQDVLLFDDEPASWPQILANPSMPCANRVAIANATGSPISLGGAGEETVFETLITEGTQRQWFVALSNCPRNALQADYQILFLNPGDAWTKQFSCEEQGVVPIYIAFFVLYIGVFTAQLLAVRRFQASNTFSAIPRLVTAILFSYFFYIAVTMLHLLVYSVDGLGLPGLRAIADLAAVASTTILSVLFVLLAQGWKSNEADSAQTLRSTIGLVGASVATFGFGMLLADVLQHNTGSLQSYPYQGFMGIAMVILRVFLALYALQCGRRTLNQLAADNMPAERRKIVLWLLLLSVAWFLSLPLCVLLADSQVHRFQLPTLTLSVFICDFLVHTILVYLLWPSRNPLDVSRGVGKASVAGTTPYDEL